MLSTEYDLIVVGGGIVGASTAREAAIRGLKVLLLEKGDLASGTSHRSTKLIHGGLRYLENFQIKMVFESTRERAKLREIAPHLAKPQSFLLPVYKGDKFPLAVMDMGVWLYDTLSLFSSYKLHKSFGREKILEMSGSLNDAGLKGGVIFYDYRTDDARLTLEMALAAEQKGATVKTYSQVETFLRGPDQKISGVEFLDTENGQRYKVNSKLVLCTSGVWTDKLLKSNKVSEKNLIRPTKGVHIVFRKEDFPMEHATLLRAPQDGRATFAIPWERTTILGTTDTDFNGNPDDVCITPDDTDYLLELGNYYFPSLKLSKDKIISSWAGLRPLFMQEGKSESEVSREHEIIYDFGNHLLTVVGGKLTTCRLMAKEICDKAAKYGPLASPINELPDENLPGGDVEKEMFPPSDETLAELKGEYPISDSSVRALFWRYGSRISEVLAHCEKVESGLNPLNQAETVLIGELSWAVTKEKCLHLNDFMVRRSSLAFEEENMGLGVAALANEHLAKALKWDSQRAEEELSAYRSYVEKNTHFWHESELAKAN